MDRHGAPLEGACFWRLNQPPSGLLTLLLRISLGRVGGDRNAFAANRTRLFFVEWVSIRLFVGFFWNFSVGYRSIISLRFFFFTNVSFFEEVGAMRCELDRFRFHVSFNVFCSVRVIDDL